MGRQCPRFFHMYSKTRKIMTIQNTLKDNPHHHHIWILYMILDGVLQSSQDNPKHHVYFVVHHILPPLPWEKYITSLGTSLVPRSSKPASNNSRTRRNFTGFKPKSSASGFWDRSMTQRMALKGSRTCAKGTNIPTSTGGFRPVFKEKKVGRTCGIELYIIVNNYNRCIPSGKNKVKKKMGLTQIGDTTQQFQWILRDYSTHDRCDTPIWFIWVWIYNDN